MLKYIEAYGEQVNLQYPSKAIQEAKSAMHTFVLLKMDLRLGLGNTKM